MRDILNARFLRCANQMVERRLLCVLARLSALLVCLSTLYGCSNSTAVGGFDDGVPTVSVGESSQEPLTLIPISLQQLEDEPGLLAEIPEVFASQTLADSGLQVVYTHSDQVTKIPALVIEKQWLFMQACLAQVAPAPVVVVMDGPVTPFTSEDDVIHSIEGIPIASASILLNAVLQVWDIDFDGFVGKPAFNLRSIMGRYLWLSANLPERDYPFFCAQQQT